MAAVDYLVVTVGGGGGEEASRVEVRPGISRFKWGRFFLTWVYIWGAWDVEGSTVICGHRRGKSIKYHRKGRKSTLMVLILQRYSTGEELSREGRDHMDSTL